MEGLNRIDLGLLRNASIAERIASVFPLWNEMGAVTILFNTVTREAWDSQRVKVGELLLKRTAGSIYDGRFTAADDFLDPHIAEEEGGALVAYFYADGEPVCCLIGCIADALNGNDEKYRGFSATIQYYDESEPMNVFVCNSQEMEEDADDDDHVFYYYQGTPEEFIKDFSKERGRGIADWYAISVEP